MVLNSISISFMLRDNHKAKRKHPAMHDKMNVTLYLIFRDLEKLYDESSCYGVRVLDDDYRFEDDETQTGAQRDT